MDLLARREHGVRELAVKLKAKKFDPELVDEVIDDLVKDKLLSDQRYCESMINSRYNRGQGPIKIRYELLGKGVPEHLIDETMEDLSLDWLAVLKDVVKKKYAQGLSGTPAERAKKVRFLSSRGFPQDMIYRVMQNAEFE
jgi:regulatory protein